MKHLYSSGAAEVIVANRTLSRAIELAEKFSGKPSTIEDALTTLNEVDIVISSTGADGYVLTADKVAHAMKRRPSRPLFMIDIAVPRDIDPAAANVPDVFLYDIDDLEGIVENNLEMRRSEAAKIEVMISEEMDEFQLWLKTLGVRPVIRALQDKSNTIHEETMESLFNKLPELDEHQRKVIRRLTKSIVNQMMHDPINVIKELSGGKQGNEALDYFSKIFALQEQLKSDSDDGDIAPVKQSSSGERTAGSADFSVPKTALAPAGLLGG